MDTVYDVNKTIKKYTGRRTTSATGKSWLRIKQNFVGLKNPSDAYLHYC